MNDDRTALARAVLAACQEEDRRPIDDGFEWYGSALELADGLLAAGVTVRPEGPGLDAPSLDEGLLARALRTSSVGPYREGDLWTPDAWFAAYARSVAREYRRLAQEGETPT